jgi:dihydrofolate synthase/folylpolyglutamate synthase
MNYKETTEYLFRSTPVFEHVGASAYKEGLYNTLMLDEHFNHPHRNYKTIHVAGTNGKGSCSHTIAAVLQAQGYKVGLYTSPHLVDFRERIRVNGKCVSEDYVIDFVEKERSFFEPLHPSFFELTTAMAFKYFAEQNVDIAVIEVGLGGRLDCTNIITPVLSIITNISFDHTKFLGNTLAKIAGEKAGIIKEGVPVVIGEANEETCPVFEAKAKEMNAPIYFAEDNMQIEQANNTPGGKLEYITKDFGYLEGELGGDYQKKNANTILNAIKVLKKTTTIKVTLKYLNIGFADVCNLTGLMGRWQKLQNYPLVICDTGHNVGGWQYLSKQIARQECVHKRIVFGMVDDKDIETVMSMLPKDAAYFFTQPSTHRAFPKEKVAEIGKKLGLQGDVYPTVESAYMAARAVSRDMDFIFIGGSSYVVADLLSSNIKFPS